MIWHLDMRSGQKALKALNISCGRVKKKKATLKYMYIYMNSKREQEMKNCDKPRNAEIKKDLRM